MNGFIGIIAAEIKEVQAIREIMSNVEEITKSGLVIVKGSINNKEYILTRSGVGKVNAARITQILIDKFDIEYIINIGSAGAINDKLRIGDIVIGKELAQHDFDITAFGHNKGHIPEVGRFLKADKMLIEECEKVKIKDINIITGIIVSGDIFLTDIDMKEKIRSKFNADCVEMEGASVAQVCFLNKVPFIVIRSISDIPNGKNKVEFEKYLEFASKNCAELIYQMSMTK